MKTFLHVALAVAAGCLPPALASAHDYTLASLAVDSPFARATPPGATIGGAYMTIENSGKADDTLVGASSPLAGSVQIHTMSMDGNVMRMREIGTLPLPAGKRVALQPGGFHLMLVDLKKPLVANAHVPLTLEFAHAGKLDVDVVVQAMGAGAPAAH